MSSPPSRVLLLAVALIPSCGFLAPDPVDGDEGSPRTAEDYAVNAKEYLEGGNYFRARDQFQKALVLDPSDRSARMGHAYCSLYIGRNRGHAGDLQSAETELRRASASFAELWDGTIEADTASAPPPALAQWSAALGLALSERALGNLATLDVRRLEVMEIARLQDEKMAAVRRKLDERRRQRIDCYGRAREKFERLAAMGHGPPEAILNVADLRLIDADDDAALEAYGRYLAIAEESRRIWARRKESLAEGNLTSRELETAEQIIASKLDTNLEKVVNACRRMAEIHTEAGRPEPALGLLTRARELVAEHYEIASDTVLPPEYAELHFHIGATLGRLERWDEALRELDTFVRNQPSLNDRATEALKLKVSFEAERARRQR